MCWAFPTKALRRARESSEAGCRVWIQARLKVCTKWIVASLSPWPLRPPLGKLSWPRKGENVRSSLRSANARVRLRTLDLATKAEPISEAAIRTLHEVVMPGTGQHIASMTAIGPQEQELVKRAATRCSQIMCCTRERSRSFLRSCGCNSCGDAATGRRNCAAKYLGGTPCYASCLRALWAWSLFHPFADGNGRVARALASVFTYRAISMPIMILSGA